MNDSRHNTFQNLPKHIGIIMDGNGRWAKQRGLPRTMGHKNGSKAVREILEAVVQLKIEAITLFAFSTENWQRPKAEVDFLMKMFAQYLTKELPLLQKHNVQLVTLGRKDRLPKAVQASLQKTLDATKDNTGIKLCLAVDYGSQDEIARAAKKIATLVKAGKLDPEEIDENLFAQHLDSAGLPDPDLIIRTSGEMRLSNFLLWQAAYAEFYFTDCLWPDFTKQQLYQALEEYQGRIRRKGGIHA